ncbi:phage tail tape measure protein [Kitasatospora sp. NPDC004272]
MTDRTVAVRLNLETSGYRLGAAQAERSTEQLAAAAAAAGSETQAAFGRAGAGIQSSMQRASRAVGTFGQEVRASSTQASAGLGRMEAAAREVPATFGAAGQSGVRAFGAIAESATAAASAVVAADTRMTAADAASAQGIRLSLETRLALGEGVVAHEAELAAAAERTAAVTVGAYGRMAAAARTWATSTRASAVTGFGAMAAGAEQGEKAFGALRTAGLLMIGVVAAASYTAAKFEKSMSGVYAVADATTEQMKELRTAALEAGRDTAFSASQAADAEAELARAGVSVADITGGALKGSLGLAAAGQLDLAESATISAQSMNTFGLKGKDVTHIADVLAAGANKSAADVHGLGESLRMGGLLAHQTGLSLEDTVGVLSMFADHALIGSDAGTSLKVMLQRLVPQSGEAVDAMQKIGFSAYDATGRFVGLTELARRMKESFSQLTPEARNAAMSTIFGSDAVRSATILYEQGAQGVDQYRAAVDDQGAAARMAAVQMDNLSGDLEQLRGSLEVALIQGGTEANKVLRDLVQWLTSVVNAFAALPGWAQTSAVVIAAVGGAVALLVGGLMLALPKIMAFRTSMTELATTMPRVASAMSMTLKAAGTIGVVLAVASAALGIFGSKSAEAQQKQESLTDAVKADNAAIGANTRAWVAHELEQRGVLKAAESLKISTSDLTEAILGSAEATERVRAQMKGLSESSPDRVKALASVTDALDGMSTATDDALVAAKREAAAAETAAGSTKALGDASEITAAQLDDTRSEADKLKDSLDKLNGANISAASAAISYQKSLQDLRDAVKDNGRSLDITTEKGRAVKSAFLDAASAAMSHAEAVQKSTGSSEQAQIVLEQDIAALKETMRQAGMTATQIDSLTAAYARVPETVTTKVLDPGAQQTVRDLEAVQKAVANVPPGKTVTIKAPSEAAIQDLEAVGYKVEKLPDGKQVKITVPTNDAFDGATRIQQVINNISGRQVKVTVFQDYVTTSSGKSLPIQQAWGGITGMAYGGMTAAANGLTTREAGFSSRPILWAEAGREAYIPMDPRKRGRAESILGQVASEFGLRLIPGASARDLIPARQLAPVGAGGAGSYDQSRTTNLHLHGARMTEGEQAAALMRLLDFYG